MEVVNRLKLGSKIRFRPEISKEKELWAENGAFGTEILRGIRKKDLGPVRPGKWKSGKTGNPRNGKLENWKSENSLF